MRKIYSLATLLAVSIMSGTIAGCSASPAPGVECTFSVNNVHKSSGSSKLMDVKASGSCTAPLAEVQVRIGYQKLVNGKWVDVSNSFTNRTWYSTAAGQKLTFMSANGTKCISGTYRGYAPSGYMIYKGTKYPAYQIGYGPQSVVRC